MKDRINKVRKHYGLSMQAFGDRIDVSKEAIRLLEKGATSPAERTIKAICKTYHVNENWLRTGEGGDDPIIEEPSSNSIDRISEEYGLDNLERTILEAYVTMPEADRRAFADIVHRAAMKIVNADYSELGEAEIVSAAKQQRPASADQAK